MFHHLKLYFERKRFFSSIRYWEFILKYWKLFSEYVRTSIRMELKTVCSRSKSDNSLAFSELRIFRTNKKLRINIRLILNKSFVTMSIDFSYLSQNYGKIILTYKSNKFVYWFPISNLTRQNAMKGSKSNEEDNFLFSIWFFPLQILWT